MLTSSPGCTSMIKAALQLGPERVTGGGFTEALDVPLP
jgi:hypothetical protein